MERKALMDAKSPVSIRAQAEIPIYTWQSDHRELQPSAI
mgnify:CR=1 FL=1|jgi:hypothetical protein